MVKLFARVDHYRRNKQMRHSQTGLNSAAFPTKLRTNGKQAYFPRLKEIKDPAGVTELADFS